MEKEKEFVDYLVSIGFIKKAAQEVVIRFAEDRADMDDFNLYRRFYDELKKTTV